MEVKNEDVMSELTKMKAEVARENKEGEKKASQQIMSILREQGKDKDKRNREIMEKAEEVLEERNKRLEEEIKELREENKELREENKENKELREENKEIMEKVEEVEERNKRQEKEIRELRETQTKARKQAEDLGSQNAVLESQNALLNQLQENDAAEIAGLREENRGTLLKLRAYIDTQLDKIGQAEPQKKRMRTESEGAIETAAAAAATTATTSAGLTHAFLRSRFKELPPETLQLWKMEDETWKQMSHEILLERISKEKALFAGAGRRGEIHSR